MQLYVAFSKLHDVFQTFSKFDHLHTYYIALVALNDCNAIRHHVELHITGIYVSLTLVTCNRMIILQYMSYLMEVSFQEETGRNKCDYCDCVTIT